MIETIFCSTFRLIRLIGPGLLSSTCDVAIHLEMNPIANDQDQETALKAMKLWLEDLIDNTIVYYPGTKHDTTLFEEIANNVMLTPDEPNDYHLCILIHSKLNAIGRGQVKVTKTEFSTDTGEGFKCIMTGDVGSWLPSQDEWMGSKSIFDQPWWSRSDGSTLDIPYEQGDNIDQIRKSISIDLHSMVGDKREDEPEKQAEIIKPPFNLKLVKDDD